MHFTIVSSFFFFNDTATTEIYTLSLHDALPISLHGIPILLKDNVGTADKMTTTAGSYALEGSIPSRDAFIDRKSTRLNSSHLGISYAVFCLKKKKKNNIRITYLIQ